MPTAANTTRASGLEERASATPSRSSRVFPARPPRRTILRMRSYGLQRLHVLNQIALLILGQSGSPKMPAVAIARQRRVIDRSLAARLGRVVNKSDALLVVNVVAAGELFRPVPGIVEQIQQRRNRAVVQIRRARPNAIQRLIGVAVRFAEVRETILAFGI